MLQSLQDTTALLKDFQQSLPRLRRSLTTDQQGFQSKWQALVADWPAAAATWPALPQAQQEKALAGFADRLFNLIDEFPALSQELIPPALNDRAGRLTAWQPRPSPPQVRDGIGLDEEEDDDAVIFPNEVVSASEIIKSLTQQLISPSSASQR